MAVSEGTSVNGGGSMSSQSEPRAKQPRRLSTFFDRLADPIHEVHLYMPLVEALKTNNTFVRALVARICEEPMSIVRLDDAIASLRDWTPGRREYDVAFVVRLTDGRRVAFLVEVKVFEGLQPKQDEAYDALGAHGVAIGRWHDYRTVLLAPTSQMARFAQTRFHCRISLEDVATLLTQSGADTATAFKADLFTKANGRMKTRHTKQVDEPTTAFFRAYVAFVASEYGEHGLTCEIDSEGLPANSTWRWFNRPDLPKGLELKHQAEKGFIDLVFAGWSRERLAEALHGLDLPSGAVPEKCKGSAALRVRRDRLATREDFQAQKAKVRSCLETVFEVYTWYRKHRDIINALVAGTPVTSIS
ncbi:hypothetical protein [Azospirillum soli]|uniref:hypothetical protein n=1 Tax=Azospirillum soli TaxID=1304799 RepID=UPI001AE9DD6A|nr:hypothetical protein [Azospirillum soli]MBP2315471.1 hypothetical protein [Azospirillum soli]